MPDILDTDSVRTLRPSTPHDLSDNRVVSALEKVPVRVFFCNDVKSFSGRQRRSRVKTDTVGAEIKHGGTCEFVGFITKIINRS